MSEYKKSTCCYKMNIIEVFYQKQLIQQLLENQNDNNNIILINENIVFSLGIDLLLATVDIYNTKALVVIDVASSLSFLIYAIEKKIPYILYSAKNENIFISNQHVAHLDKSVILSNKNNLIEYLLNNS